MDENLNSVSVSENASMTYEAVGTTGKNMIDIASTIKEILKDISNKMEGIGDGPTSVWKSESAMKLKEEFNMLSSKFDETYEAIRTTGEAIVASKNIMEEVERQNNSML